MWIAFLGVAWSQICDRVTYPESEDPYISVAWIAPRTKRVSRQTVLTVVPTVDLRAFVKEEEPTVGRLLEYVGLRGKRRGEPRRAYKVVVFDVPRAELCRPIDEAGPTELVGGLRACEVRPRDLRHTDGCGYGIDRRTFRPGPTVFQAPWEHLIRGGFCVLPAERFLHG